MKPEQAGWADGPRLPIAVLPCPGRPAFPPEALDTQIIEKIRNKPDFRKYYSILGAYDTIVKGFSYEDKGYNLPDSKDDKQKELNIKENISIPYVGKPIKVKKRGIREEESDEEGSEEITSE